MASIQKEFTVAAAPDAVWDALRDVGAVHRRLAQGFVTDTTLEAGSRLVTFANGLVVRERIVTVDDTRQRLVYAVEGGRTTHYNASVEVFHETGARTRIVWTIDLLPDDVAGAVAGMMDHGVAAMTRTLESPSA